jgi:cytochrome c551/c552
VIARRSRTIVVLIGPAVAIAIGSAVVARAAKRPPAIEFRTSDRCVACHNGLLTASGDDVSIGFDWRASMMANSSRDPYWQGSVRRETIDHPESKSAIEDECSVCHMPIPRYMAKLDGRHGQVFAHLPFTADKDEGRAAADGVSCSVCHQISKDRLGTAESFNGGFVVQPAPDPDTRPEYGPFEIETGHTRIMRTSSEGYRPTQSDHIRQSEVCATCHTLFTQALGPGGSVVGRLPEQVPYQEWLHSDYRATQSCQSCHMPAVREPAPITRVFGAMREGVARHQFVAANFFMLRMLNRYRDALEVAALPQELASGADTTIRFLASQSARIAIAGLRVESGRLAADVVVENDGGHKLPTAYPSRRAWIHVTVRDRNGRVVFESGALRPDGSVLGNDNDADPTKLEPHYAEIRSADQVQIYESVLGDPNGRVTTGLLAATTYLKDNRLLPRGFDKRTAAPDIAVHGEAQDDPDFVGGSDRVRYSVAVGDAQGPFTVDAELLYQPIGFRWANNLKTYDGAEPRRFTGYFDAMAAASATTLAQVHVVQR